MPLYSFRCLQCCNRFIQHLKISKRDSICNCPNCNSSETKRIIVKGTTFSFADNPNSQESTKDDKYWENAEKVKLAALEKRRKERYDKVMSKDPETIAMLKRKADNEERLGKTMDDPVRLKEANEIRNLIK